MAENGGAAGQMKGEDKTCETRCMERYAWDVAGVLLDTGCTACMAKCHAHPSKGARHRTAHTETTAQPRTQLCPAPQLLLLLPHRVRYANIQNSHAEATCALHIHEKAVGGLDQPLELVLGPLQLSWRVEQINIAVEHLQTETAPDQQLICVVTPAKRCQDTAPGRQGRAQPTACCWCHL